MARPSSKTRYPEAIDNVDVSEEAGVRTLHLGSTAIQSAMRVSAPFALELAYTRAMLAALLFQPLPRDVMLIGLGGGSFAKFIHRHMAGTRVTAVEINPKIVAVAHAVFHLPPEDERLAIQLHDGSQWVAEHPGSADLILLDAFDGYDAPLALTTEAFFENCRDALRPGGMLAANLWNADRHVKTIQGRLSEAFGGRLLRIPVKKEDNAAVLAFRDPPGELSLKALMARARDLERELGLEFPAFVDLLKGHNPHGGGRLFVG